MQRRAFETIQDQVMVATRRRGKPRVELVTDGLCPGNDLAGRVHAGVCSTGANELDGFVRDLA